jgi:hypothetical protein
MVHTERERGRMRQLATALAPARGLDTARHQIHLRFGHSAASKRAVCACLLPIAPDFFMGIAFSPISQFKSFWCKGLAIWAGAFPVPKVRRKFVLSINMN